MIKHFRSVLLAAVDAAILIASPAPQQVAAATALTMDLADDATAYMEWMLDIRFTAEQRQRYQRILQETFRGENQGAIEAVSSMARANQKLGTLSDTERNATQQRLQTEFVKLLRKASDNDSRWLLSVYDAAHTTATAPVTGGVLGRWSNGHVSMIQYRNSVTGVSAPTNGNHFSYEFHADGTYSFTGLMQSVMYNCTTAVFSNETGTYRMEGNSVSLRPERNPYKMTNNCVPSSNRESPGKLIERTYLVRVYQDGNYTKLDLTGADGGVQSFSKDRQ